MMIKLQLIVRALSEIRENISSGLFLIDDETMDELIKCGARQFEQDELEILLNDAIECLEMLVKLGGKVNGYD